MCRLLESGDVPGALSQVGHIVAAQPVAPPVQPDAPATAPILAPVPPPTERLADVVIARPPPKLSLLSLSPAECGADGVYVFAAAQITVWVRIVSAPGETATIQVRADRAATGSKRQRFAKCANGATGALRAACAASAQIPRFVCVVYRRRQLSGCGHFAASLSGGRCPRHFPRFEAQQGRGFDTVKIVTLTDAEVTGARVREELDRMTKYVGGNGFDDADDLAVMFVSSHGFAENDLKLSDIQKTGFAWEEGVRRIRALPATNVLLLLDNCFSGGAGYALPPTGEAAFRRRIRHSTPCNIRISPRLPPADLTKKVSRSKVSGTVRSRMRFFVRWKGGCYRR